MEDSPGNSKTRNLCFAVETRLFPLRLSRILRCRRRRRNRLPESEPYCTGAVWRVSSHVDSRRLSHMAAVVSPIAVYCTSCILC
jgi:hypothetical protein